MAYPRFGPQEHHENHPCTCGPPPTPNVGGASSFLCSHCPTLEPRVFCVMTIKVVFLGHIQIALDCSVSGAVQGRQRALEAQRREFPRTKSAKMALILLQCCED